MRPYKTSIGAQPPPPSGYGSVPAAFNAVPFHNRETFQIVSPGGDGVFGAVITDPTSLPIHFVTELGEAVVPNAAATDLAGLAQTGFGVVIRGYQDQQFNNAITVNGHLDNVTNFSSSTLESDLP